MASGIAHELYYALEGVDGANYGVSPTPLEFRRIRNTGVTLALSKETFQSEEIRSDRQIYHFRHGARQVGKGFDFELSYGAFDDMIEAVMMGDWTQQTGEEGDTHIYMLKTGKKRRSYTFERQFNDIGLDVEDGAAQKYHRYTGCELATMSLSITAENIVTGSFEMIGQDAMIQGNVSTATYQNSAEEAPMDAFSGTIEVDGVGNAVITEMEIELDNNIEPRFVIGQKNTIYPNVGRVNVSGQITAYFENTRMLQRFYNEVETSISLRIYRDHLTPQNGYYDFILPCVKFTDSPPDVKDEGPIVLSMPFQALADSTAPTYSGSALVIVRNSGRF